MPMRVFTDPDTPVPEVHLLSNGRYHVMVTSAGGGYSRWHDLAVTRWREEPTRDYWGTFCYLRDAGQRRRSGRPPQQPTLEAGPKRYEAIFTEGRARISPARSTDVSRPTPKSVVSPEDDIELRRVTHHQSLATRRDDRNHQLCRSGARAAGRGRVASGLQQSVRADRDHRDSAGDPLHAPAALRRGTTALDACT